MKNRIFIMGIALGLVSATPAFGKCAFFGCLNADPYCAFRTITPEKNYQIFSVQNKVMRACICGLPVGSSYCVNSDGKVPEENCKSVRIKAMLNQCS